MYKIIVLIIMIFFLFPQVETTLFNLSPGDIDLSVKMAEYIDLANNFLDIHFYEIGDEKVIMDALSNAGGRGCLVRVIVDSGCDVSFFPVSSNINIINNLKTNIMLSSDQCSHNKFMIIRNSNKSYLWTGSFNANNWGNDFSAQNVVIVTNESVIGFYQKEFDVMWGSCEFEFNYFESKFGVEKTDVSGRDSYFEITDNDLLDRTAFSPPSVGEKGIKDLILETIALAKDYIYFSSFIFTDDDIARAVIDKMDLGVKCYGLFEGDNVYLNGSEYSRLHSYAPHSFIKDNVKDGVGDLHHKYLIIDPGSNGYVVTGSCNYTYAGFYNNDENALRLLGESVSSLFLSEFWHRFRESGGVNMKLPDNIVFRNIEICIDDGFVLIRDIFGMPENVTAVAGKVESELIYSGFIDGCYRYLIDDINLVGSGNIKVSWPTGDSSAVVYFEKEAEISDADIYIANPLIGDTPLQIVTDFAIDGFSIYDEHGRIVFESTIGDVVVIFSTFNLPSGVYLIKIDTKRGYIYKKVVYIEN